MSAYARQLDEKVLATADYTDDRWIVRRERRALFLAREGSWNAWTNDAHEAWTGSEVEARIAASKLFGAIAVRLEGVRPGKSNSNES